MLLNTADTLIPFLENSHFFVFFLPENSSTKKRRKARKPKLNRPLHALPLSSNEDDRTRHTQGSAKEPWDVAAPRAVQPRQVVVSSSNNVSSAVTSRERLLQATCATTCSRPTQDATLKSCTRWEVFGLPLVLTYPIEGFGATDPFRGSRLYFSGYFFVAKYDITLSNSTTFFVNW